MARGDVLRVALPPPPGGTGREQSERRPAIVVQTDSTTIKLPTLMIVPLTSRLSALRFPHTVRVEPSSENGLSQPSVLLVFQLRAIDTKRAVQTIGHLEQEYLGELDKELRHLLDL